MAQNLEELDDKPISGKERQFLLQLHIRKLKREQAEEQRRQQQLPGEDDTLHNEVRFMHEYSAYRMISGE